MTGKCLVVADGDIIAYRCAAAIEKNTVEATHKETLQVVTFDTATAFKEWARDDKDNWTLEPKKEAEDISHAIHAMKGTIDRIVKACGADSYHIVVSGEDNFRKHLPLPTRYKDNRKATVKPIHLKECKQWLIDKKNAEIADGEADDALVAYAYDGYINKRKVIQATLDKDGNGNAGWLYNWHTMDEPELIEGLGYLELVEHDSYTDVKGKGRLFTYFQMAFGDPADCYKPCELAKVRFGEKGAYKLLHKAETDKQAVEALAALYKKWYPKPTTYRAWDETLHTKNWIDIWQMYADCVHMQRWEGDRLDVRKLMNKLGINYE